MKTNMNNPIENKQVKEMNRQCKCTEEHPGMSNKQMKRCSCNQGNANLNYTEIAFHMHQSYEYLSLAISGVGRI